MLRTYLATAFLARFADEGVGVALALLAVERTGRPALGGFVLAAWLAPHALAAPVVGALAERTRTPRLLHGCALALLGTALALLALTTGRTPLPLTLAVALAGGSVGPLVTGGLSSLLAEARAPSGAGEGGDGSPGRTAPGRCADGDRPGGAAASAQGRGRRLRDRGFAYDAATYNAAAVTAPAAVAGTAAVSSAALATVLLAVSAGCAALLCTTLRLPAAGHRPPPAGRFRPRELGTGFRVLRRTPQLATLTLATCVAFLGAGALPVTAVLLARARGASDGGGLLMTAFAVGGLAGSLAAARWSGTSGRARAARLGLLVTAAGLAGAALTPSLLWTAALFLCAGLGEGPLLSATLRLRADHAPEGTRAQVFTLGAGLKLTAGAAGTALVGALAALPPHSLLLLIAALQLAAAALLRGLRRRRPASPAQEPEAGTRHQPGLRGLPRGPRSSGGSW
ncbi:MFS transporter [Streptomyces qinglanensis]|uniref:MFS transporter n=1 Tax=Streptomyces qinglanensis TaxID=943816 RepID=UPI00085C41EC|nr:MFS transporter [Streptomyces qinglanensis]